MKKAIPWQLLLIVLVLLATSSNGLASPTYYFRDLGVFDGISSSASGLNDSRQVVGRINYAGGFQGFSWTQALGMELLGPLAPGKNYRGYRVNNSGNIAGWGWDSTDIQQGFYKPAGAPSQVLQILSGPFPYTLAQSLNESNNIVGFSNNADASMKAVVWWNAAAAPQVLGSLGGDLAPGRAMDINNSQQIVGFSHTQKYDINDTNHDRPFYWTEGTGMVKMGTLRTDPDTGSGEANAINNAGLIIGVAETDSGVRQAFWSPLYSGFVVALAGLGGQGVYGGYDYYSYAFDVNDSNQTVGFTYNAANVRRACFWDDDNAWAVQDLNDLVVNLPPGVSLMAATGINAAGDIVGVTSTNHAFIISQDPSITITPVPGSLLLLGSGLLGLGGFAWRRLGR
ncbi:MAG: hypothetical protein FJ135_03385 [Deltaproteobacteria bacterium]|nr:hypothetical protein [Deltaproteobacteria bacterium]